MAARTKLAADPVGTGGGVGAAGVLVGLNGPGGATAFGGMFIDDAFARFAKVRSCGRPRRCW
jgi:hypothetical protein